MCKELIYKDTAIINLKWWRKTNPINRNEEGKYISSVEFELNHNGRERLERNIHSEDEYIMCFVHFEVGTEDVEGIYLSVWDNDDMLDSTILTEDEKKEIIAFAVEELREARM